MSSYCWKVNPWTKRPITVEAVQVSPLNIDSVAKWCGGRVEQYWQDGTPSTYITIKTLEGDMKAYWADFVIKGVAGEFYPCRADIFFETYMKTNRG